MTSERWSVSWKGSSDDFAANVGGIIENMVQEASQTYLGYQLCRDCGAAVPEAVCEVIGRRCVACFRTLHADQLRQLEILVDGARSTVAVDRKRRKYGSRGSKDTRRKAETAKRRALRRLRWADQALYAALLASEREKLGLEPSTLSAALQAPPGTISDPETYDPGHGIEGRDAPGEQADPERGQPLR